MPGVSLTERRQRDVRLPLIEAHAREAQPRDLCQLGIARTRDGFLKLGGGLLGFVGLHVHARERERRLHRVGGARVVLLERRGQLERLVALLVLDRRHQLRVHHGGGSEVALSVVHPGAPSEECAEARG